MLLFINNFPKKQKLHVMSAQNGIKNITPSKNDKQPVLKNDIPRKQYAENKKSLEKTEVFGKNTRLESEILKKKAQAYDTLVSKKAFSLRTFCRRLHGVNTNKIYSDLYALGYLYKEKGIYRVYSAYRDVLFAERCSDGDGNQDLIVLDKGQLLLIELYNKGKLSMRKNHMLNKKTKSQ